MGNPIGKQDQYAVAFGGFNNYRFNQDDTVFVNPIICRKDTKEKLENHLMFFYTGITRMSSDILCEQKSNVNKNKYELDEITKIAIHAHELLNENMLDTWGELLDESWKLKKKLAGKISTPEIDLMYRRAKEAGAIGGKIIGAGGGGFLMLYVPLNKQNEVEVALKNYRRINMHFEMQGSRIIYVSD